MDGTVRAYDAERDFGAVVRIWQEIGWIESAERQHNALKKFLSVANAEVAELNGAAECLVHWAPGSIQYQDTPLPLCAITAVTTSLVGRKHGFASTMTARALGQAAEAGCAVAALGMFEQGFYDRFGFGTGAYEHVFTFDPATLKVDHVPYRTPERLTLDDAADVHEALARRNRPHGSIVLDPRELVEAELAWDDDARCLGYRNSDGRLTHFLFGSMKGRNGPWSIKAIAYENAGQLLELLRLLRDLADQLHWVKMPEPAEIQLQVLLAEPERAMNRSGGTDNATGNSGGAWMQLRVLDLAACVSARSFSGPQARFNLVLTDPIADLLDHFDGSWRGIGGDYVVTISGDSSIESGHDDGLETLECDVASFSRLWFSVAAASVLVATDNLVAPPALLAQLDEALRLPQPHPGMYF